MAANQGQVERGSSIARWIDAVRTAWESAWLSRRVLMLVPTSIVAASVVVVLLVPHLYRSEVTFVPEVGSQPELPSAVASLLGRLNISSGGSTSPDFYVQLVSSRPVLDHILRIRPVATCRPGTQPSVLESLNVDGDDENDSLSLGRKALRQRLAASSDLRTGIVWVGMEARCPVVASELADSLIAALNSFNVGTRQSSASARRRFLEGRVAEAEDSLGQAEAALESFLTRNRSFDSPELQFQRDRLARRVTMRQDLATSLRTEFELARVEEVNSTPVITLLEPPNVPVEPSRPRRKLIVLACAMLGAMFGFALAVLRTLATALPAEASERVRALHRQIRYLAPKRQS